jgi:hypothetical protein
MYNDFFEGLNIRDVYRNVELEMSTNITIAELVLNLSL